MDLAADLNAADHDGLGWYSLGDARCAARFAQGRWWWPGTATAGLWSGSCLPTRIGKSTSLCCPARWKRTVTPSAALSSK
jgi:hypothetical protein